MIRSQKPTPSYRKGWDNIFGKKKSMSTITVSKPTLSPASLKLLKLLKLDPNKTYKSKVTGKQGKITRTSLPCNYCITKMEKGDKTYCGLYVYLDGSIRDTVKSKELEEVVMTPAPVAPVAPVAPSKSGFSEIPVDVIRALVKAVEGFVENEQMFTCFDVTKRLKLLGFVVIHSQVRKLVHGLSEDGATMFDAWQRVTHTFPIKGDPYSTGSMTAEVYAPSWLSVSAYDPYAVSATGSTPTVTPGTTRSQVSGAIIPPVATPAPSVVKPAKVTAPAGRTARDARGRLCVPNALVRKLGLKAGDVAHIIKRPFGTCVWVRPSVLPGQNCVASLIVDKDDNIRITRKALEKAGIDRSQSSLVVTIDGVSSTVIIVQ